MNNHKILYDNIIQSNKDYIELDSIYILFDLTINDIEDVCINNTLDIKSVYTDIIYLNKIIDFIRDNNLLIIEGEFIKNAKADSIIKSFSKIKPSILSDIKNQFASTLNSFISLLNM